MTRKEILAIADEVVEIYFNENISVEKAITKAIEEKGEDYEFKMDRRAIS